jgi:hypothetical protein
MLRLDPNWNLSNWLDEKAVEELELVESHLGRERLRLEQRLHRIETLVKRLRRQREVADNIVLSDPNQRNLFDVYETTEVVKQNAEDQHREPMVDFGALDFDDDPLLAIVAEHIMAFMENEKSSGKMVIHFKQLLKQFIPLSIREEEIDEAISILLQKKMIIEIDQDIFGLEN